MNDRELLEMAARAAGFLRWSVSEPSQGGFLFGAVWDESRGTSIPWNPLTNDGDALSLAVKLGMVVDCDQGDNADPSACVRREIVACAAEIGRAMP